jgi:hypothetical protein
VIVRMIHTMVCECGAETEGAGVMNARVKRKSLKSVDARMYVYAACPSVGIRDGYLVLEGHKSMAIVATRIDADDLEKVNAYRAERGWEAIHQ